MSMRWIFLLWIWSMASSATAQESPCRAEYDRQQWWASHPESHAQWLLQNQLIETWIERQGASIQHRSIITIPVVVHVVWNQPEENISNEQILSQIEALNQDFRALNSEIPLIPTEFKPLIADVGLEFCLANVDPQGNPTTGITRTFTNNSVGIGGTTAIHFTSLGGRDAWDPTRYLNIWVAKFAGGISGTATFPGQSPPEQDGVEINYRYFGTIHTDPPYNLGRTLTHEVGHYFNLEHPWGPSINDCCGDDFVADTPPACQTYLGQCPVHPQVSCILPDIFMDYMFYTDDACMGMFTLGQKARMLAALELFRPGLLLSGACTVGSTSVEAVRTLSIFPNPASHVVSIRWEGSAYTGSEVHFKIFDPNGRTVQSGLLQSGRSTWILDVSTLQPGLYWISISNATFQATARFVKL